MPKQIVCALVGLFLFVAGCPVPPDTADMMDGTAEARRFTATLSGDNEVPAVDSDATGTATLELNEDETELTYTVNVAGGEGITQAHIHVGAADANGPIVVFLFGFLDPGIDVDGELASGTLTGDDLINDLEGMPLSALVDELRAGNAYVNVHSEANPPGEIRGQIEPDAG